MKVAAIIPARYNSSRFKGKPLENICSRPMIWWVYNQVKQCSGIDSVSVAADDERIKQACEKYNIPCLMTSPGHKTSTERIHEASKYINAGIYICVNGDEPLIQPQTIEKIIPKSENDFFAANLITQIKNPAEAVDESNIKVAMDMDGCALFMSRSPIPHPKSSIQFNFYKHLGVLAYSKQALDFFAETEKGPLESIEDINELRFIEHGKKIKMIPVEAQTLSVDTPKDLKYVSDVIRQKLERGELKL